METEMKSRAKGHLHGLAVRRSASFAVQLIVAFGKDIALNVRRGGGYLKGFAHGLVRGDRAIPNA
jgi:hypothetical protein